MVYNGFGAFVATEENQRDTRGAQNASDYYQPTTGEVMAAGIGKFLSTEGFIGTVLDREEVRRSVEGSGGIRSIKEGYTTTYYPPTSPLIDEEKFKADKYHPRIEWFEGMREETAQLLSERQEKIDYINGVFDNATTSQKLAGYATGFVSAFADPFNILFAFTPVPILSTRIGASISANLARSGPAAERFALRFAEGSASGAFGAALAEPFYLDSAQALQDDYTYVDSLMNIILSAGVGGGLHSFGGLVGDRLRVADTQTADTAAGVALRQGIEGRKIDVEPVFNRAAPSKAIEMDPFDPNLILREGVWEPSRQFDIGQASGKGTAARFKDYTPVRGSDAKWLDNVVYELDHSEGGSLTFLYNEDAPGSTVIANPGTTPEWFQQFNAESTKANRDRKIRQNANRRKGIGDEGLPPSEPILTRELVRSVAEKLKAGEPLGKREGRVAELLMQQARDQRERNVNDMLEVREGRRQREEVEINEQAQREEELDSMLERSQQPESITAADFEASREFDEREISDYDIPFLEREIQALEEDIRGLELDSDSKAQLDELTDFETKIDNMTEATRLSSICMRKAA